MLQVEPTSHSGPVAIKSGRNISEAEKNLMAIGGGISLHRHRRINS